MKNSPWTETELEFGPISQAITGRADRSLDILVKKLTGLGVKVHRPEYRDYAARNEFYGYCPRDTVLIIGDKVIRTPTLYPSRRSEWETLRHAFGDHPIHEVDDPEAVFDAANICRMDKHILYLVSDTGNIAGARWLQSFLGKEYHVHILKDIYAGVHIDSTITPIREGLVMLNSSRVNPNKLPIFLRRWDKIWFNKEDIVSQPFEHYPYASDWIAMNFLMVDENTAVVDPKQTVLKEKLAAHGVDCVGVDLTESRTLGGGHHCVTLDLLRAS
jgi:glycine amidinotransferase/scyllo-inosamine-4-phosphate amidinotransferase 1